MQCKLDVVQIMPDLDIAHISLVMQVSMNIEEMAYLRYHSARPRVI